jgi:hypothetical protein
MFRQEKSNEKKAVLAELAVLSAGRDLMALAAFGLELSDQDASTLLAAFGEIASASNEHIFQKWCQHQGHKTQMALIKILNEHQRSRDEELAILEAYASGKGSYHRDVISEAKRMLKRRWSN